MSSAVVGSGEPDSGAMALAPRPVCRGASDVADSSKGGLMSGKGGARVSLPAAAGDSERALAVAAVIGKAHKYKITKYPQTHTHTHTHRLINALTHTPTH